MVIAAIFQDRQDRSVYSIFQPLDHIFQYVNGISMLQTIKLPIVWNIACDNVTNITEEKQNGRNIMIAPMHFRKFGHVVTLQLQKVTVKSIYFIYFAKQYNKNRF